MNLFCIDAFLFYHGWITCDKNMIRNVTDHHCSSGNGYPFSNFQTFSYNCSHTDIGCISYLCKTSDICPWLNRYIVSNARVVPHPCTPVDKHTPPNGRVTGNKHSR